MKSLWSDEQFKKLKGVEAVVYASRLIGQNPNLVLWGGGNSSMKVNGIDHTGKKVRILWIKGSGSDMRTITGKQFCPLRLEELLPLFSRKDMSDDEMVAYQAKCSLDPSAPKASIETLLHAFIPAPHVYHTHADAICALTDTVNGGKLIQRVFGKRLLVIPYYRPGFKLSRTVGEALRKNPEIEGLILDKHGLITWGNEAKGAYLKTIEFNSIAEDYIYPRVKRKRPFGGPVPKRFISRAKAYDRQKDLASALLMIRGAVSSSKKMVLLHDDRPSVLEFVNSKEGAQLSRIGPFTPDHLMHVKPKPLFLDGVIPPMGDRNALKNRISQSIEKYRQDYEDYFNQYKSPNVTMLDPNPRIILIPGAGMVTTGKDLKAASIVRDLYLHTIDVIKMAGAIDRFSFLSKREICDFEYWPMENYKLTLLPPEKEFSRQVVLVTGGSRGIGRSICEFFLREGANVIMTDIDLARLEQAREDFKNEILSGQLAVVEMDVTQPKSVEEAYAACLLKYGGLDIVVSNAGYAKSCPVDQLQLADWEKSFQVNATGHFLVSKRAIQIFKEQGIGGNIIFISTKNVLAPGKDFGAYSASKAAETQLARILAIENGEYGIRVNIINPDGVFLDSGLWNKEVRSERAKAHGISLNQVEDFYAKRNILKTKVLPEDVARAVLFLASSRSAKTTGSIIPVDGGVKEAFPR
ncbi:MAG: bifunctional rhamnulose-1-phosphate aldolase/short-chain dehydrogenase [Nitrospirae bacterium]|nr:bifunctional rhamnulose-1-phosphate aldolase/short-chain dehydrogenase [Nitrospirota bacterium]MBI3351002.1 bifunctional rhamnulose-1-phosphate aldolase/short-chain dehydrogenase [Nitrospirota bacterium]